ncbi:MAG: hypothetical protein RL291_706 [Pseudomonadota bacterium]|jgi:hypothetical protein
MSESSRITAIIGALCAQRTGATITRDDLIWAMAEAAWAANFCHHRGDHTRCTECAVRDDCFELSGGFVRGDMAANFEWFNAASAALDVIEGVTGLRYAPEEAS